MQPQPLVMQSLPGGQEQPRAIGEAGDVDACPPRFGDSDQVSAGGRVPG
ncbi:Uncharacterised protein [Acinetobacter baumannii]|nr:Uncharacterised protein [Acinetobacter baumannii]